MMLPTISNSAFQSSKAVGIGVTGESDEGDYYARASRVLACRLNMLQSATAASSARLCLD
jgi:hypothetical protein